MRNAVFGNVGTMISFRVSADDAPILAKQFEPQFEPNDLLQMHNRNFIINMVINGEKAPAFSARTLNLPTATTDNTAAIIANTRTVYGQPRATVEKMISDKILPPQTLQTKGKGNPEYTNNQKKFLESEGISFEDRQPKLEALPQLPTMPQITPELELPAVTGVPPSGQGSTATPAVSVGTTNYDQGENDGKKKRKRSRSRKKKSDEPSGNDQQGTAQSPSQQPPQVAPPSTPALAPAADNTPEPSTMLNIHHAIPTEQPPAPAPTPQKQPEDPTLLRIR